MLIGIHGFKQSGKDTLGQVLVQSYAFKRLAFADKVKESLATIFNIPKAKLWGSDEDKQSPSGVRWSDLKGVDRAEKTYPDFLSIRELMQIFATEVCRDKIPGIWVNFLPLQENKDIVVTDVRFENEARFILEKGGQIIEVVRSTKQGSNHESESGLAAELVSEQIKNDGDLESFLKKSRSFLESFIKNNS